MRISHRSFVIPAMLLLIAAPGVRSQPSETIAFASAIKKDWASTSYWSDGKAEMAEYEGRRVVYGQPRAHTLHLITVTEDFNKEFWAKADWPYGQKPVLPVVKQNQLATIPTPNYPYHYMGSVFFERGNLDHMVKMTISSQEWCGSTFKEYQLYRNPAVMKFSSYWDGQGTGEARLERHDGSSYFEEELPLLVRAIDFRDGLRANLYLYPNQTTNKAPVPEPSAAALSVTAEGDRHWRVEMEAQDGRVLEFIVERDYPNALTSFAHSDGRSYELVFSERRAYWE